MTIDALKLLKMAKKSDHYLSVLFVPSNRFLGGGEYPVFLVQPGVHGPGRGQGAVLHGGVGLLRGIGTTS